jgi:hypothetical protein
MMAWYICSIPCECGINNGCETGRPIAMWFHEHWHNFKEGLLKKIKISPTCLWGGHKVSWDKVKILEIQSNSRYRKYKKSNLMECLTNITGFCMFKS